MEGKTIEKLEEQTYEQQFIKGRPWWQEIVLVCALVAPNFVFGNEYLLLVLPFLLLYFDYAFWKPVLSNPRQTLVSKGALRYFWPVILFVFLALMNKIINGGEISCLKDYYAAFYLIPVLLFTGKRLFTRRTYVVFIAFVLIETAFGVIQYLTNDRSLLLPLTEETHIQSKALLYDSRVYGFGVNSSVFALHIFIAFLFLLASGFKRLTYWLVFAGLIGGMLLSFGRAVVVMAVLFFLLTFVQLLWNNRKELKQFISHRYFLRVVLSAVLLIGLFVSPWMQDNLARGGKTEQLEYNDLAFSWDTIPMSCSEQHALPLKEPSQLDTTTTLSRNFLELTKRINTSGRKLIWLNYVDYLSEYPWTGNGSNKLQFRALDPKTRKVNLIHAHNSFFVFFGSHGFILGALYMLLLLVWWQRKNIAIIGVILAYSLLQYGIFWGFSLMDIVFMAALMAPVNLLNIGYKR
jgi:hypothetical protein